MNARESAINTLVEVIVHHKALDSGFSRYEAGVELRQRPMYKQLVFGVLRHYHAQQLMLEVLLEKPLKKKHLDIAVLLHLALFELSHLKSPDHAVVDEAVKGAAALNKSWASGLVNAVLRRAIRESDLIKEQLANNRFFLYSHPDWLFHQLKADWPDHYQDILSVNNTRAPLTLRVNRLNTTREAYLDRLRATGIAANPCLLSVDGLNLSTPMDVAQLPGFSEGDVSVQDEASQLVIETLSLSPGMRILDACAAPGGKTCHMLERCPGISVTAVDREEHRLNLLRENLQRLKLDSLLICADAGKPGDWWSGETYQRILIDAPCSATGIIRRQPDIKLLRKPADIDKLAQQQRVLLEALWPLLAVGGQLIYTTCSVIHQENRDVVATFLADRDDVCEVPLETDWGLQVSVGRQLLPILDGHDGFYYARLQKR